MQNWNQWSVPPAPVASAPMPPPPTTGYQPPPGQDPMATMQAYMQYYNQPAPSGYTPEQWATAQQQNWAQWQQWQQQYQQWQAQYGEKYQETLKQYNTSQAPPLPISTQPPPPPPKEDKQPPPPPNSYQYQTAPPLPGSSRVDSESEAAKKAKAELEELSEAEKTFDAQFKQWEEKFNQWKLQNANHPDKTQYKQYEAKWTSWREKLIERREQMRKKREQQKLAAAAKTDLEKKDMPGGDKIMNILSSTENQGLINNLLGIGKTLGLTTKQDQPTTSTIAQMPTATTMAAVPIPSIPMQTITQPQMTLAPDMSQTWGSQWAAQYNPAMATPMNMNAYNPMQMPMQRPPLHPIPNFNQPPPNIQNINFSQPPPGFQQQPGQMSTNVPPPPVPGPNQINPANDHGIFGKKNVDDCNQNRTRQDSKYSRNDKRRDIHDDKGKDNRHQNRYDSERHTSYQNNNFCSPSVSDIQHNQEDKTNSIKNSDFGQNDNRDNAFEENINRFGPRGSKDFQERGPEDRRNRNQNDFMNRGLTEFDSRGPNEYESRGRGPPLSDFENRGRGPPPNDFGNWNRGPPPSIEFEKRIRGPHDFDSRGPHDFDNRGPQDFDNRGPQDFDNRGPNEFRNRGINNFGNRGPDNFDNRGQNEFGNKGPNKYGSRPLNDFENRGSNEFGSRGNNDLGNRGRGPNNFTNRGQDFVSSNEFGNRAPTNYNPVPGKFENRGFNEFRNWNSNEFANRGPDDTRNRGQSDFDSRGPNEFGPRGRGPSEFGIRGKLSTDFNRTESEKINEEFEDNLEDDYAAFDKKFSSEDTNFGTNSQDFNTAGVSGTNKGSADGTNRPANTPKSLLELNVKPPDFFMQRSGSNLKNWGQNEEAVGFQNKAQNDFRADNFGQRGPNTRGSDNFGPRDINSFGPSGPDNFRPDDFSHKETNFAAKGPNNFALRPPNDFIQRKPNNLAQRAQDFTPKSHNDFGSRNDDFGFPVTDSLKTEGFNKFESKEFENINNDIAATKYHSEDEYILNKGSEKKDSEKTVFCEKFDNEKQNKSAFVGPIVSKDSENKESGTKKKTKNRWSDAPVVDSSDITKDGSEFSIGSSSHAEFDLNVCKETVDNKNKITECTDNEDISTAIQNDAIRPKISFNIPKSDFSLLASENLDTSATLITNKDNQKHDESVLPESVLEKPSKTSEPTWLDFSNEQADNSKSKGQDKSDLKEGEVLDEVAAKNKCESKDNQFHLGQDETANNPITHFDINNEKNKPNEQQKSSIPSLFSVKFDRPPLILPEFKSDEDLEKEENEAFGLEMNKRFDSPADKFPSTSESKLLFGSKPSVPPENRVDYTHSDIIKSSASNQFGSISGSKPSFGSGLLGPPVIRDQFSVNDGIPGTGSNKFLQKCAPQLLPGAGPSRAAGNRDQFLICDRTVGPASNKFALPSASQSVLGMAYSGRSNNHFPTNDGIGGSELNKFGPTTGPLPLLTSASSSAPGSQLRFPTTDGTAGPNLNKFGLPPLLGSGPSGLLGNREHFPTNDGAIGGGLNKFIPPSQPIIGSGSSENLGNRAHFPSYDEIRGPAANKYGPSSAIQPLLAAGPSGSPGNREHFLAKDGVIGSVSNKFASLCGPPPLLGSGTPSGNQEQFSDNVGIKGVGLNKFGQQSGPQPLLGSETVGSHRHEDALSVPDDTIEPFPKKFGQSIGPQPLLGSSNCKSFEKDTGFPINRDQFAKNSLMGPISGISNVSFGKTGLLGPPGNRDAFHSSSSFLGTARNEQVSNADKCGPRPLLDFQGFNVTRAPIEPLLPKHNPTTHHGSEPYRNLEQEFCIEKQFNYDHGGTPKESIPSDMIPSKIIEYGHNKKSFNTNNLQNPIKSYEYNHGKNKPDVFNFENWKENEQILRQFNEQMKKKAEKLGLYWKDEIHLLENNPNIKQFLTGKENEKSWDKEETRRSDKDRSRDKERDDRDRYRDKSYRDDRYIERTKNDKDRDRYRDKDRHSRDDKNRDKNRDRDDRYKDRDDRYKDRDERYKEKYEKDRDERYKERSRDKDRDKDYREKGIDDLDERHKKGSSVHDVDDRLADRDDRKRPWSGDHEDEVPSKQEKLSSDVIIDEKAANEKTEDSERIDDRCKDDVSWEDTKINLAGDKVTGNLCISDNIQNVLEAHPKIMELPRTPSCTMVEDILCPPGRLTRPSHIAVILRGPPGSGKSYIAKLIKDKEVSQGGSAPRILSIDDYFLVEKDSLCDDKKDAVDEMEYKFEEAMEPEYFSHLIKAFKKNITDGYFNFIILDSINEKISDYEEMWSFAKTKGFSVFICEMEMDVQICMKRNIHKRSEDDINRIIDYFEPTPNYHQKLDVTSLLQETSIENIEMETSSIQQVDKIQKLSEDSQDSQEDEDNIGVSKWEKMEAEDKLDRLDGLKKKHEKLPQTMEEFLQVPEYYNLDDNSGKKRVKWADLEERKHQEKMRAVGFVVGQTNWNRMMDPSMGSSALTRTKYI